MRILKTIRRQTASIPLRIVLPVVLTVVLFVGTIFGLILPNMEARMMADRRAMIRELTQTAWSVLRVHHGQEKAGRRSRADAQQAAIAHIRQMRYGPESKDYFWINDMHPHLIMHPYRSDLEGSDVSGFVDPSGKRLFVECVETVKSGGEGYVDYQWQWKDDPQRIVPKISFVKGFKPWQWVVGTGIYVEDVRSEIAAMTRRLTGICLSIMMIIIGLSTYIVWQGIRNENRRREADKALQQADKMATLGTLVSGVAHEINNPVTFVMLNTPLLNKIWQEVLPVLDDHAGRQADYTIGHMPYAQVRERIPLLLGSIEDGAQRIKAIVGDLKDYARRGPPKMDDAVDINRVVGQAAGLVSNLVRKHTDHFSIEYEENMPSFQGNVQQIEQVLINLLVNACQALPHPQAAVRIQTEYDAVKKSIRVVISDQGRGMSPDILQRIRDPFFTTKREDGGTGLGLAIAERIVETHRGEMRFESVVGQGTTVTLSFPAGGSTVELHGGADGNRSPSP